MTINHSSPTNTIKAWQNFLNQQGFNVGTADGIWGPHTESGSKQFQSANGLTVDGIVGSGTLKVAATKGFELPQATGFNPQGTLNAVFDISHLNSNPNFVEAKAAGMQAVFHKATQYTNFIDKTYAARRIAAEQAGLLWGAYHFGAGGDGASQAAYFLDTAKPDGKTLLVLDFETNTISGETTMTLQEAKDFINYIQAKTGKYPGLYGGGYLRDIVENAADPVLSKCWLWFAEYGNEIRLPNGWTDYSFWQYTDGVHGPGALQVEGIGVCDRDLFNGSSVELASFWGEHAC